MGVILLLTFISTNVLILHLKFSNALESISPSESMGDGKTLVSKEGTFELGFFSPGISNNSYLGIWYKNIPLRTIVWVANRRNPINGTSGLLKIDDTGNLVLLIKNSNVVVWSSNSTIKAQSPIVQLLDSGNLVLRDKQDANTGIIWQSFDYPCDTLLPGMKLGWDLKTGFDRRLSSWKSPDNPSPGDFTWTLELQSNPEGVNWKGSNKYYRSGPWNGIGFSGAPEIKANPLFYFNFVSNDQEVYYSYDLKDPSVITRSEDTKSWILYASVPRDYCDNYGLCGVNGNCIISAMPVCQCLEKFKPKSVEAWNTMDWSQGCVRNKELECQKGDGFIKLDGLKVPDATHSWVNKTMNLKECRAKCLQNCSCTAYTNLDIRGRGSGCAIWFGDLIDIRQVPIGGQTLYVRLHASEIASLLQF
ncbi:PREDICTED: G-type lectin S-receptor-like serine/threonine-protein kinase At4g27290 isoform X3 [Populus euphratica]|uniref:G-type lectin S-receptor-like serine/threonine-protein kinase At4g27290 isoform X3 n=1 Tax=Populus euphratica TaxID=75702 RepID=A0AAJ6XET0_POPEU|nr:PREDICTED: G-type lectin S-receptor-like serine/threonine-protein kinase At4g27290 isoform X3 [Populus euphratica]